MKISDIKKQLKKKKKKKKRLFLSTGSTLLNLACTGNPHHGFVIGHYHFIVGDSASGKTFLSLTCLAEACLHPFFNHHRFIYDNSEGGAMMDIKKFFGKDVSKRMEAPDYDSEGKPIFSGTIEEFYFHVDDAVKQDLPFVYILDSMDSLSSEDEAKKFDDNKEAHRKGKALSGSYGDGKAKKNAANLRRLLTPLKQSNSILIIINQTRDNLGFGFEKKTRSGGHALRFYACLEIWSSIKRKITKTVKKKKRQLGIECRLQVKKNRVTGREREVIIPIYHSFGIDDIGSCVDYLLDEGHWKMAGKDVVAKEFKLKAGMTKLIKYIEEEGLEKDLREIVGDVWWEIEEACKVKRKRKYE